MFIFFFVQFILACDGGMFPEGKYHLPYNAKGGVETSEEFMSTIKQFEKILGPWVEEEFNHELVIFKSWASTAINAYAEQEHGKYMISIYGGLARFESMNVDSLSLTLCHELGHHLGGAPKKPGINWSSAEGQADYYSTMKCLKKLWQGQSFLIPSDTPQIVLEKCQSVYQDVAEFNLCVRSSLASKRIAKLFQFLDRESFPPEFETPDPQVVGRTDLMHPFSQCRLDTYFQGSLCDRPVNELMDDWNENKGVCQSQKIGFRPRCWYLPVN